MDKSEIDLVFSRSIQKENLVSRACMTVPVSIAKTLTAPPRMARAQPE
jgi:hypothetical protein